MKVLPTLEGGLRVDAEDRADWQLLAAIPNDATDRDSRLAHQLGGLVTDHDAAEDWRDFVVPELDAGFQTDIARVASAIQRAHDLAGGKAGPLWIAREEGTVWYSVLNQARLAIEDRQRFGPGESINPASLEPEARSAFLRSRFYCAIQSVLLDHVM